MAFKEKTSVEKLDLEYLHAAALIYPHYYDQTMRIDESVAKTMETIKILRKAIDEQL